MARRTRRQFLGDAAGRVGAFVSVASLSACEEGDWPWSEPPPPKRTSIHGPAPGMQALTAAQLLTTVAACECILPADEDPGATDLGVVNYIDRLLSQERYLEARDSFLSGLELLDEQMKGIAAVPFHAASREQQEELLRRWQNSGWVGEYGFFRLLLGLTMEGAFGDPVHGGNKNGWGFEMIGFVPGPPMPGQHLLHLRGK